MMCNSPVYQQAWPKLATPQDLETALPIRVDIIYKDCINLLIYMMCRKFVPLPKRETGCENNRCANQALRS